MIIGLSTPILAGIGVVVGLILGWIAHILYIRRQISHGESVRLIREVQEHEESLRLAETQLSRLTIQLTEQNRMLSRTRQNLDQQSSEHERLLLSLDDQQAAVNEVSGDLATIQEELNRRRKEADRTRNSVHQHLEELTMLTRLQESQAQKLRTLAQQAQEQDSKKRRMLEAARAKTREIDEAQALLTQREAELRRLNRQRQQREVDIDNAKRALAERDAQLQSLIAQSPHEENLIIDHEPARRVDPPQRHHLPEPDDDQSKLS